MRQLGFTRGVVELVKFLQPSHLVAPSQAAESAILHMGFQVDYIVETATRVEEVGGRLLVSVAL